MEDEIKILKSNIDSLKAKLEGVTIELESQKIIANKNWTMVTKELIAQKTALEKENAELKAQNTELTNECLAGGCKAPATDILKTHVGSFEHEIKQNDNTLTKEAVIEIKEIKVSTVEPRGRRKKATPKKRGKVHVLSCPYCDFKTEGPSNLEEHVDEEHWDQNV